MVYIFGMKRNQYIIQETETATSFKKLNLKKKKKKMEITFTELLKQRQLTNFVDPITRLKNVRHFMYM